MAKDYHTETAVMARYDEETIARLDRLARKLKSSRAAVMKLAALAGLDALERETGIAR